MQRRNKWLAMVLMIGLIFGTVPAGAFAAASSPGQAFVLPAGDVLTDDELNDVNGEALPIVLAAVGGYVLGKLADAAWERYVDPWLEETVWPWVDEKLGISR